MPLILVLPVRSRPPMADLNESSGTQSATNRRKPKATDPVRMSRLLFLVLLLGSIAAAVVFVRRGDYVMASVVPLIAGSAWMGFHFGLCHMLVGAAALGVGIKYAVPLGMLYQIKISAIFGTTGLANRMLGIAIAGILVSLLVSLVGAFIASRFLARRRKYRWFNQHLGLLVGGVEGAALVLLVCSVLISTQAWRGANAQPQNQPADKPPNKVAYWLGQAATQVRQSTIAPHVHKWNPFSEGNVLAGAQTWPQQVAKLRDPATLKQLANDPQFQALSSKPEFQRALSDLREDSDIQAVLKSKEPLTVQTVSRILQNEDLMRIVDEEGFWERVSEILKKS